MNTLDAILTRRSCREFTDQPIENEKLHQLLEAAMSGPSCVNAQDWSFVVVTDPEKLAQMADANGRPAEPLRKAAAGFAENGYREIVLCGINLGFYGMEWDGSLAEAVETCAAVPGVERVRLGSLEPERLTEEQLSRLAALPQFCPQFHLSLQSGCDRTLRAMNRKYDSAEYAVICQRIRRYFPDCAITTDFMVGFPGETDEDFRDSLAFAQRMAFAAMHVFRYSPRAGTRAAAFPEQCSGAEKTARMEQAQKAAKTAKENFLKSQIGTEFPVLFERERGDGYHVGHTPNGTVVRISAKNPKKSLRNRIFCVRIEESDAECCYGTLTESGLDEDL